MSEEVVKKKKKPKVSTILVCALLILLTVTAGFIICGTNRNDKKLENAVHAQLGQLEGKSNAEIEEELNRIIDESSMAISINSNPVFIHGLSQGTIQIENSPANHYAQNVIITRNDNGEKIYESGLLMPNYHIQTDVLAVDLDAGEYECTATFTSYKVDGDEKIEVGSAACEIKVTVLS